VKVSDFSDLEVKKGIIMLSFKKFMPNGLFLMEKYVTLLILGEEGSEKCKKIFEWPIATKKIVFQWKNKYRLSFFH